MQQESEGTRGGFVCDKCGASFDTQDELDRHIQSEHMAGEGGHPEGEGSQAS